MDMNQKVLIACLILTLCFDLANSDCLGLPVVENSYDNSTGLGPYMSGTVIEFKCNIGFKTTGGSNLYTCSGESWKNDSFRCEEIYCGYVETPENVIVKNTPNYKIGSSIIFGCKEGYNLVGQPNAKCENDGTWLPSEPPKCQIKMCRDFGSIQHARTSQDSNKGVTNGYGSKVMVTCEPGYAINGSHVVMCQVDGSWGKRPTCKEKTCSHFPCHNSTLPTTDPQVIDKDGITISPQPTKSPETESKVPVIWIILGIVFIVACTVVVVVVVVKVYCRRNQRENISASRKTDTYNNGHLYTGISHTNDNGHSVFNV